MMIDAVTLRRLWPHAPQPLIDAVVRRAPAVLPKYGITTRLRLEHFLAQISHESGGGEIVRENLNYPSAQRIAAVWPRRFTVESAAPYVRNPRGLADKTYNGRMGNRPGSDDGFNFRGGGLLQLTGRDSYREIGAIVGLPLEQQPDLVGAPTYQLDIAAAEFRKLGCLPFCDADNIEAVTRRVNGGYIGLADRKAWLVRVKAVLAGEDVTADAPVPLPAPVPVQIPRGSDDHLPPAVEVPGRTMTTDRSTWAAIVGIITTVGSSLGQAVDAVRPLLTDPRTIAFAAAIALAALAVILYERRASLRAYHV